MFYYIAEYTVSDVVESTSNLTHKPNSFKVIQNGSTMDKLKITGAEIGDTFTLTAAIPGTNVSTSIRITVGADSWAYIQDGLANDAGDNKLRPELGYKK